eukprot:ANDGO_00570.mRNA.1 (S)-coclaurine N-methyltransferase
MQKSGFEEKALSKGWIPDAVIRFFIRRSLEDRLRQIAKPNVLLQHKHDCEVVSSMRSERELAVLTNTANEQHYECPTDLFRASLGAAMKYSCCFYPDIEAELMMEQQESEMYRCLKSLSWMAHQGLTMPVRLIKLVMMGKQQSRDVSSASGLDDAEQACFKLYVKRAELDNLQPGARILDLGCGWGSLSLFLAAEFPEHSITAVSNSRTQREYIEEQCRTRGIANVKVITCDMNVLELEKESFDRIMSVEMLEHMRNYERVFQKVGKWLRPGGKMFVHVFAHSRTPYMFEQGWMARNFFSGGSMPSIDLFPRFCGAGGLFVDASWIVNGRHYARTLEAWLSKLDCAATHPDCEPHGIQVMQVLRDFYGQGQERKWLTNWRVFYMACAEMFAFNRGNEWVVVHYLFAKPETS